MVVGFRGTTLRQRPIASRSRCWPQVLSGQGGRLFVELRDKKRALAYRVSAFSIEGIDPGYFAVYVATSPENLEEALAGIHDELRKVIDKPVTAEELERAKRYLVGAHDISLQRKSALASTLAFHEGYGLGWHAYRQYTDSIMKVKVAGRAPRRPQVPRPPARGRRGGAPSAPPAARQPAPPPPAPARPPARRHAMTAAMAPHSRQPAATCSPAWCWCSRCSSSTRLASCSRCRC